MCFASARVDQNRPETSVFRIARTRFTHIIKATLYKVCRRSVAVERLTQQCVRKS